MTHSLIIAHQRTVDTLERLEDEEVQQLFVDGDGPSPPLTPGPSSVAHVIRLPARQKQSQSFDDQNFRPSSPARGTERKRASVWINDLMFDKSPLPPGFRRRTWGDVEFTMFLEQQPYCLQKWTDQGKHVNKVWRERIDELPGQDTQTSIDDRETVETTPPVVSGGPSSLPSPISKAQNGSLLLDLRSNSDTASSPTVLPETNTSGMVSTAFIYCYTDPSKQIRIQRIVLALALAFPELQWKIRVTRSSLRH
jgi:hypothetical protein